MAKIAIGALIAFTVFLLAAWPTSPRTSWVQERHLVEFEKREERHVVESEKREAHESRDEEGSKEQDGDRKEEEQESDEEEESRDKEEEELEEEQEVLQYTIAVLVCGFIVIDVILLYLVNFPDENIRSYIYKMLSSTLSIFLAVTMNIAGFSLLLEQILPSPWPRGLNIKVGELQEFIVGMILFFFAFFTINIMGYLFRHLHYLKALRIIGGHITAFAGITTFGTFQIGADQGNTWFRGRRVEVLLLTAVVLLVMRILTEAFRIYVIPARDESEKSSSGEEEWINEVCEAEDDATSLVFSFMTCQFAIWKVTGHFVPLPPHKDTHTYTSLEIYHMGYVLLGFVVLLVVAFVIRRSVPKFKGDSWQMRVVNGFQAMWPMTIAWAILRVGHWITSLALQGTMVASHDMANIANAGSLTAVSIICVMCLDALADKVKVQKEESNQVTQVSTNPNHSNSKPPTNTYRPPEGQFIDQKAIKIFQKGLHNTFRDDSNLEKAIRVLIESFGLLVGLCWEKATDAAIETIIEGNEVLERHRVISKICAAALVFAVMFPAWIMYVMPPSEMNEMEWLTQMEAEKLVVQAKNKKEKHAGSRIQAAERLVFSATAGLTDDDVNSLFERVKTNRGVETE